MSKSWCEIFVLKLSGIQKLSFSSFSVVIECPLRVQEVYGSNPPEAEFYQRLLNGTSILRLKVSGIG